MYNDEIIKQLVNYIQSVSGQYNKDQLSETIQKKYGLTKDRKVFFCEWFAIRFSWSKKDSPVFNNVVLSLSMLHKYDHLPFIVCLTTPSKNYIFLANTTFLKKISHSSHELRINNIRGSFLGSDIIRNFEGISNEPENFQVLFDTHENFTFQDNLVRLVEATNNIAPTGKRFSPSPEQTACILSSVDRAISFIQSSDFSALNEDLNNRVQSVKDEIAIAAFIDNVNLRGRIIEYLITAEGDLKETLMKCLRDKSPLPEIYTSDELGDYERVFPDYVTETDIKTKIMFLSSNPKGYNVDKLLSFLATENSVYLVYIVGVDNDKNIHTQLCSLFNNQLLNGTRIIQHWAGRNSRGVSQYDGKMLESILSCFDYRIDSDRALNFLTELLR